MNLKREMMIDGGLWVLKLYFFILLHILWIEKEDGHLSYFYYRKSTTECQESTRIYSLIYFVIILS